METMSLWHSEDGIENAVRNAHQWIESLLIRVFLSERSYAPMHTHMFKSMYMHIDIHTYQRKVAMSFSEPRKRGKWCNCTLKNIKKEFRNYESLKHIYIIFIKHFKEKIQYYYSAMSLVISEYIFLDSAKAFSVEILTLYNRLY